jgi:hypothetical protein
VRRSSRLRPAQAARDCIHDDRRIVVKLTVNGAEAEVDDRHAKTPLLWVLRDVLSMTGTKFASGRTTSSSGARAGSG